MESISDPKKLGEAWSLQYEKLAGQFASMLPPGDGTLVEIGCGSGQLTIPLARLIGGRSLIGVDRFAGPYAKDREALMTALARRELKGKVQVILAYGMGWLSDQRDCQYEAVISSEFLPELSSYEVEALFSDCYRVLKPGGVTIHSFLSPKPRNPRQKLVVDADSDSRWSRFPPKEWFSPPPRLMVAQLRKAGFREPQTATLKSNLTIRGAAARLLLSRWGVRESFWDSHKRRLTKGGLEIPDWIVVLGRKPSARTGAARRGRK
jgi:cyclopropane fatty-acyl-phospholipid synthase-like methyltransferase